MYRLLHLTDTHLYASTAATQRGINTHASLERVLAATRDGAPDGVLISGDLCQDESRDGYRHLRALLDGLDVPVICLPGNHDDLALMQAELPGDTVSVLGDHTLGGWRLLATDCTMGRPTRSEIFTAGMFSDRFNASVSVTDPAPAPAIATPPIAT